MGILTINTFTVFIISSSEMRYGKHQASNTKYKRTDCENAWSVSSIAVEGDEKTKYKISNVVADNDQTCFGTL